MVAFAIKFGQTDILRAELEAILLGLQLCIHRNFTQVEVETDSALAVNMIEHRSREAWKYAYIVRKIRVLLRDFSGIHFGTQETNMVADSLAKWAHNNHGFIAFHEIEELPLFIRKLIFIDRIGLPYFRLKCRCAFSPCLADKVF